MPRLCRASAIATWPRIARSVLPLEALTMVLRSPASDLPPCGTAILSDGDAADIFAYLQFVPAPQHGDMFEGHGQESQPPIKPINLVRFWGKLRFKFRVRLDQPQVRQGEI